MTYEFLPGHRPELMQRILSCYESRADLRAAIAEIDSLEFWKWLNTYGLWEVEGLLERLPPIPPEPLQNLVSGRGTRGFLVTAANTLAMLVEVLASHGLRLRDFARVLDFGCGCGRTLRIVAPIVPEIRLSGSDICRDAIEWCRENLDFARFEVNGAHPPLAFEEASFDFIYAISVFSHLSEQNCQAWIEELRRVAAPGGWILITTHGPRALRRALDEESMTKLLHTEVAALDAARLALERDGIAFIELEEGGRPGLDRKLYGQTFVTESYVRETWCRELELVACHEGAMDDWQDVFLLRN